VEDYDFSVYTRALADMTDELPPELGRLLEDVLQRYFSSQSLGDKKTMLASLYQQGNSAEPLDHMVALLKGAGPFLQKMVQQLGSQAKDPAVATALQALKENLNPIADEERLVLLSGVARSIGAEGSKMSNIRVLSSASVAETLAVTLEPPEGQGGVPREVVVKLLRPGIVERAGRERAFFERVAAERGREAAGGGDGLVRTMASIADQIESELDLRFEAAEIQRAQVYAGRPEAADGGVQVMTMTAGREARAEFLILDKMPGRSVKGFVAEMEAAARNPETTPELLANLKAQGEALCQRLITLNTMWFKEAFYGSGFYHGDLHAGNLMVDTPEGGRTTLGLIDFGNAATLDPKVQRDFLRIQAAAEQYHPNRTIDALRGLLPPDARPRLDAVRPMLLLELKGLMLKDRENVLKGDLVGEFLSVATQLGIEIPGAMLQFGRSQGMLQDTFNRVQKALTEVSQRAGDEQASIAKDALDDATRAAITGNKRALIGKAGLGFGMAIRNVGGVQAMFNEFQNRPESAALIAQRNKEREDYGDMASDLSSLQQRLAIDRDTLGLVLKDKAKVWDADETSWQDWVANLRAAIGVADDQLERFRGMCRAPDSVADIADWVSVLSLASAVDPENETIIARLLELKPRVDDLSARLPPAMPPALKPVDLVDAVLKAERDNFKAQVQAGAVGAPADQAAGAPDVPQVGATGERGIPAGQSAALQEAVAQRLSSHILSEGAGVGQPQPA
jgi:predicted unusual protein kinase regulating ubiquinone biosynthesis (AarF/ABC1/UbiB family)